MSRETLWTRRAFSFQLSASYFIGDEDTTIELGKAMGWRGENTGKHENRISKYERMEVISCQLSVYSLRTGANPLCPPDLRARPA